MTEPVPFAPSTYSGDPATSLVDEVRFQVQDTGADGYWLLTDLEIQHLIDRWAAVYDSITYVAAVAAGVIARKFAGVTDISADGVSVSTSGLSDRYLKVAAALRQEYKDEGATGGMPLLDNILSGTQWDPSIEPLEFGMHAHDNPAAGRQSYGGLRRGAYDNPLLGGA
jgi:hypothetical protein